MATRKAIEGTTDLNASGAGSGPPMEDPDHLLSPMTAKGSTVTVTKDKEIQDVLRVEERGVSDLGEKGRSQSPIKQKEKQTWVSVAQGKQTMKKYEFDISISNGESSVEVPSEIIEKANPLWEDFVIARFLEKAPHVAKVHMILNKIWAFGDKTQKLDVYEMDEMTMRIRITNEKVRSKVVRRGMWNIAGVPMVVSKWSPEEDASKAGLIPLWVHVTNVPMSMYSWEGLSFITSAAGEPDHLHPETVACTNFEIAKVFVNADLTKELPQKINYNIQGVQTTVHFMYPWLPPRCVKCGRWGHYETFCKENKKESVEEEKIQKPGEKEDSVSKESEDGKIEETAIMSKEKGGDKEEEKNEGNDDGKKTDEKEIEDWKTVSAEKTRRSPKPQALQFGQVTIATPSRFAALRNTNEKGEEIDKEEVEEVEEVGEEEGKEDLREEGEDEVYQRRFEESIEDNVKEIKKGRARQTLPRQSKTNHRVVIDRGSNKNL